MAMFEVREAKTKALDLRDSMMPQDEALDSKWKSDCSTGQAIGRGTSSDVYLGISCHTRQLVAVKRERAGWATSTQSSRLCHEYWVYERLGRGRQVPIIHDLLSKRKQSRGRRIYQHFMVMERLGPSLHKTMQSHLARPRLAGSGLFFSLQEVASIGAQMVSALEFVHDRHFVHQDIRPEHIVYDIVREKIKLIGFGTAQRYRHPTTLKHFPELSPGPTGSPIFTSIHSHLGRTLSRRDDMESLGYALVYIFRGSLPWKPRPGTNIMSCGEIVAKKTSVDVEALCGGLEPLFSYLDSVKKLEFHQQPDYDALRRKLKALVM